MGAQGCAWLISVYSLHMTEKIASAVAPIFFWGAPSRVVRDALKPCTDAAFRTALGDYPKPCRFRLFGSINGI
ncbi:hypothetical protein D3C85_1238840 [compost metagenome]